MAWAMLRAIEMTGPLMCPAPSTDPSGTYGVVKGADGLPEIKRLTGPTRSAQ